MADCFGRIEPNTDIPMSKSHATAPKRYFETDEHGYVINPCSIDNASREWQDVIRECLRNSRTSSGRLCIAFTSGDLS